MVRLSNDGVEGAVGQVKFFKSSEGYGFIKVFEPTSFDDDVFFHFSEYDSDVVYESWWLTFDIIDGEQGPKATNLRRVSQPPEHELTGTSFDY